MVLFIVYRVSEWCHFLSVVIVLDGCRMWISSDREISFVCTHQNNKRRSSRYNIQAHWFHLLIMSRDLLQRRVHNGDKWGKWESVLVRPEASIKDDSVATTDAEPLAAESKSFTYGFGSGQRGSLTVHTAVLQASQREALCSSVLSCQLFRQYIIQAGPEPRAHFLLHEDATDDWER